MSGKPTPGEWTVEKVHLLGGTPAAGQYDVMSGNVRVAITTYSTEGHANARLIAAAPELLAACEAALAYLELCDCLVGPDHMPADKGLPSVLNNLILKAREATDVR